MYHLDDLGHYALQPPDNQQRYWIEAMNLFLGVWQGTRENRTGYWLRWWTDQGELLPWGAEQAAQERQRAERLASQLRAAGIEPEV
jgi:hypothetical protein